MPTSTSKPAAKKTASKARKGPTKAAALKALGLTQEDLDTLKAVAAAREAAKQQPVFEPDVEPEPEQAEELPSEDFHDYLDEPVDTPTFYARNKQNCEVNFRLTRQQEKGKKRTTLKPRGQRADMIKLEAQDLRDPELETQIAVGLIEVITEAEARKVIQGQSTNQQTPVHPAFATIRNELGEAYTEEQFKFEQVPFEQQGTVVARVEGVPEGASKAQIARGGLERVQPGEQPINTAPGGNPHIISDGAVRAPRGLESEFARDKAARDAKARGIGGPKAGGITEVTIAETQKA